MGQLCSAIFDEPQQQPHQQARNNNANSNGYPGAGGYPGSSATTSRPAQTGGLHAVTHQPHGHANAHASPPAHSPPQFNGKREWPASSSAGDAARFQASVHAKRRGELLGQSQAAWQAGDKAAAKTLSEQGKAEGAAMDRCNAEACELYFRDNNQNRGLGLDTIDLHGLHVDEAIAKLEERIQQCSRANLPSLVVIVGRGNHSQGGATGRKIKPAVEKLIAQYQLAVVLDAPNEGCVTIQFHQSGKAQGFVTAPHVRNNQHSSQSAGACLHQ